MMNIIDKLFDPIKERWNKITNIIDKFKSIRKNFLRLRGGKLISIESYVIAMIVVGAMCVVSDDSIVASSAVGISVVAFIVGFVFPILIGMFKSFAWIVTVVFSFFWGLVAFLIVGGAAEAIGQNPVIFGLLAGILFFGISFVIHKKYTGLALQSLNRKNNG